MDPPRVILVTDVARVPDAELLARIDRAGALPIQLRGRLCVQLRDVELGAGARLSLGQRLRAATSAIGARLMVNDRLDLALALGADGVHLRSASVSVGDARALVGAAFVTRACHTRIDVLAAAAEGADGVLLSPVFTSPGKGPPIGLSAIQEARAALDGAGHARVALYALGGVDAARAAGCFDAGASGVAVVRADLGEALSACLREGAPIPR